jgi:hypothetical protein
MREERSGDEWRDRHPQGWEEVEADPVFDKSDFANDIGTATYIFEPLTEEIQ